MPEAVRNLGSNSNLMRAIETAGLEEIQRTAQRVADQAVVNADNLVKALYVSNRAGDRRRPGRHLLGSFQGEVKINGRRVTIVLKSSAPAVKVNSLNYGSAPHIIEGHPNVRFPRTEGGFDTARQRARPGRRRDRSGGGDAMRFSKGQAVVDYVAHPGTNGTHFLETALERAVSTAYRTAVRIPR